MEQNDVDDLLKKLQDSGDVGKQKDTVGEEFNFEDIFNDKSGEGLPSMWTDEKAPVSTGADTFDPKYFKKNPAGSTFSVPDSAIAYYCRRCKVSSFKSSAAKCAVCGARYSHRV